MDGQRQATSGHSDKAGSMPARYQDLWQRPFRDAIEARLRPGMTMLDIGGGRHPAITPEDRPAGTTYIGMDPVLGELEEAPDNSYDRMIASRAEAVAPDLTASVDLIVSWQVFEHVQSLAAVLNNSRSYLTPGGTLISMFSGRWSAFAIVNRLIPQRLGFPVVDRINRRTASNRPIFPAQYDACSYKALIGLTAGWTAVKIVPFYRGATYFGFSKPLLRAYLAYENLAERREWRNFATHYLLIATS